MIEDSGAVISEAERQLEEVQALYEADLRSETVSPQLQTRIKNLVENQRSAVEYVAHAVQTKFGDADRRSFFPIVRDEAAFSAQFDRQLPGVGARCPGVKAQIESVQPYHAGMEWLADLAELTNENKHRRLSPQTRQETLELRGQPGGGSFGRQGGAHIQLGNGASIRMSGGASISFGGAGPMYSSGIQRRVLVDWVFEHLGKSAIGTLREIQAGIPLVVESVCSSAGL